MIPNSELLREYFQQRLGNPIESNFQLMVEGWHPIQIRQTPEEIGEGAIHLHSHARESGVIRPQGHDFTEALIAEGKQRTPG